MIGQVKDEEMSQYHVFVDDLQHWRVEYDSTNAKYSDMAQYFNKVL